MAHHATHRAADVLAATMIAHGVDRVFCVPGESYLALLDALHDVGDAVHLVVARHESGAGFMAMADARCTGRPGVCLVSRGPGATNAAIAVHSAEQDAAPLVVLVGQVPRSDLGRGSFQEVDYRAMFGRIAKAVLEVPDGSALPGAFAEAYATALMPTPGPVVIAVPEDVFDERVAAAPTAPRPPAPARAAERTAIDRLLEMIGRAERPLVIAGGALDTDTGRRALRDAAHRHGLPVALSYKRQDLFDNGDPLFAGYLGFKTPRAQVQRLAEADLVLAAGTRLGDVTTQHYTFPAAPAPAQTLIHVHADARQIGRVFRTDQAITADPALVLEALASREPAARTGARLAWTRSLHERAARVARYEVMPRADGVEFGAVVRALAARASADAVVAMDGGNFGGWVHRLWPWTPATRLVGTAGGAMGMGVPGAVAAALRYPGRQVYGFAGDGGFMMTGAELATAVMEDATATVVVANNRSYGAIRQQQEKIYPGRVSGSDLSPVDFAAFAEACGARGYSIDALDQIEPVLGRALAARGPVVIDVRTSLVAISAYMDLRLDA